MKTRLFLMLMGLFLISNYSAQKRNPKKLTSNKQQISRDKMKKIYYFNEGENRFLEELGINITFKNVIKDDRRPLGADTAWKGVGVVQLELMGIYTRPKTIQLSTMDLEEKGYVKSVEFNDLKIILKELSPQPTEENSYTSLQGKYKIGLIIEKRN